MRHLLTILLLAGSAFAQDGILIQRHRLYDTTKVEDYQKIKRRRFTADVYSTGIKIDLWGGECFFKAKLRNLDDDLSHYETGMRNGHPYVKYGNDKYRYRMYINLSGNFEFDAQVRSKPVLGQYFFPFDIRSQGLTFHYQDTLSDIDKLDSFRPDSVIGSYAVYHSTGENNVTYPDGRVVNYAAGKAFHVYRPKVWDSGGDTIWGFIEIDTVLHRMKIGADSTWMANATYPVTLDPILGLNSKGETPSGNSVSQLWGMGPFQMTEDGTGTAIAMWTDADGNGESFTMGVYSDNSDYPGTLLRDTPGGNANDLADFDEQSFDSDISLSNGAWYWLVSHWGATASTHYYDAVAGFDREYLGGQSYTAGTLDETFPAGATNAASRKYSVYITYTATGGEGWQGQIIPVIIQ